MQVSNIQLSLQSLPNRKVNFYIPLTRYIFQMAIANTRVKDKRGKELMVLTTAVRDFINAQEKFTKELLQQKN